LETGERGALVMPDLLISDGPGGTISMSGGAYDPDTIRAALLFFNRLDSPASSIMQFGEEVPPGLEGRACFQRSRALDSGDVSAELYQQTLLTVFQALEDREGGLWSIATSANAVGLPPSAFGDGPAFKFALENALPVPDRAVSYDEVLLYRGRRKSELQSLRHHMEGVALEVARDGFSPLSRTVAMERFLASIDDYCATRREANFRKRLSSLELKFNWAEAVRAIAPVSAIALGGGTALEMLSAGAACIAVESTLGFKGKKSVDSPFEYVFRAGAEL